ncbi:hypothetical protein TNCV_2341041 [Trichonephila clavipes]|nr:hypothetical protein TNCV_2341041 [Trichonephila clavipes]
MRKCHKRCSKRRCNDVKHSVEVGQGTTVKNAHDQDDLWEAMTASLKMIWVQALPLQNTMDTTPRSSYSSSDNSYTNTRIPINGTFCSMVGVRVTCGPPSLYLLFEM